MNGHGSSMLLATYQEKRELLLRFLAARLGSREEAEDVAQELFIRASRTDAALPGEDGAIRDPSAYLFRMALNLARDHRRERARTTLREAQWMDANSILSGGMAVHDAPSAEQALAARQRLAQVRAALEELSPQCRRVFELHKFEGLSHAEVAEKAGISRSTVEKHMHTALAHLMARLGPEKKSGQTGGRT